jgi:hypothetical protein
MLQNENIKFQQVAKIKRRDRLLQASIILASISVTVKICMLFVQCLANLFRTSQSRIWIGSMLAGSFMSVVSKLRKNTRVKIDDKNATIIGRKREESRSTTQKMTSPILERR